MIFTEYTNSSVLNMNDMEPPSSDGGGGGGDQKNSANDTQPSEGADRRPASSAHDLTNGGNVSWGNA